MNKIGNITRKTLFALFSVLLAIAVTLGVGTFFVDNADASGFSITYKYAKTMMPKGVVGQEYKLASVVDIEGDCAISCKVNFDDESVFSITNGKFTPDKYGVYTIIIDPADSGMSNEEFNVLVESADGEKTFDYAGNFTTIDGSVTCGEATVQWINLPTDWDHFTDYGTETRKVKSLMVDLNSSNSSFTFNKPVNIATKDAIVIAPIFNPAKENAILTDYNGIEFFITLTDAQDPNNSVTIRQKIASWAYYALAGHSGMNGDLVGKQGNQFVTNAVYGTYVSLNESLLFKGYNVKNGKVNATPYDLKTGGTIGKTGTATVIADLKNKNYVGDKIWAGFSGSEVYVTVTTSAKASFAISSIGQYDLTDETSDAYGCSVSDFDPTVSVETSTEFYTVGQEIDLLKGVKSNGLYGSYIYSPLVDVSAVKIEGNNETPISVSNDGKFVPQQSGIYVCSYVAKDFDGDCSNTVKSAFVVIDKKVECTLKNVSYEDCIEGDTVNVQSGVLEINGTEHSATAVVYYPDGSAHNVSSFKAEIGLYRIEYRVFVDDVLYTKNVSFYAKVPNFVEGEKEIVPTWGQGYYPDYVTDEGLQVELLNGQTFIYNKVINVKDLGKGDSLIRFYAMPHILDSEKGVADADTMYIRLTDVYDPTNYITVHINEYDGARDTSYYRVAIGTGASASAFAGINWFNKYGTTTSSASLSGYGPYGKNYDTSTLTGEMIHVNNAFVINLDYAKKELFINSERSIARLDNVDLYSTPWAGFTTGECYLSIFFADYRGADSARILVTDIAGKTLTNEFYHLDTDKPIINVDFEGYSEQNLPFGISNVEYPIFNANAIDGYCENLTVSTCVFYDYYGACYSVPVNNGKFKPTKVGVYSIVYSVTDYFGNSEEKIVNVNVLAENVGAEIILAEEQKVSSAFVGQSIQIPKFKVSNANGKTVDSVVIYLNDKVIAENVSSFVPTSAGVYTISYQAQDFLGIKNTLDYKVTVTEATDVVVRNNPSLPKFFIDEYTYILDDLIGYAYSNGTETAIKANVSIIDKDGKKAIQNGEVTPCVQNSGDLVNIVYQFENGGKTTELTFTVPTYKVYKTVGEESKLDMSAYFVGDVVERTTNKSSVGFTFDKDGAVVHFVSDILVFGGLFEYNLVQDYTNFESFDLLLTDSKDGIEKIKFTIKVADGVFNRVVYNGNEYILASKTTSGVIEFSADGKTAFINGTAIALGFDVNGMVFNGFKNGRAYVQFTFNGVSSESALAFTKFNNQLLDQFDLDIVRPDIRMNENYGGTYFAGTDYVIKLPVFGDVLDPSVRLKLSVSGPDGKYLTAKDGTVLNDILCDKEYTVTLYDIGNYAVKFTVGSTTQKGGVYFWNSEFFYSVRVKDVDPPIISANVKDVVKVKVGKTVKVPKATVIDNHTKDLSVHVYVLTPQGSYAEVVNNSFVAEYAGEYVVTYMAIDEAGNMAVKTYTVVCK